MPWIEEEPRRLPKSTPRRPRGWLRKGPLLLKTPWPPPIVASRSRLLRKLSCWPEVKEKVKRVKTDRIDAKARAVAAYHDRFEDMSKYKDLSHHFMTAGREQLVERIVETHPEWDISFLRDSTGEVTTSVEIQDIGESQTLVPTTGEGP
ncbi:hypothetical protein Adt_31949 [Abeliophyllum distichum]|uniref:Uncharacterized protein n=1 Tax=Abeliophyllum distichum TaxID=126358 RepID=A0ABD1RHE9_9LAMI